MADGEPTLDPQQTARIAAKGARDSRGHKLFKVAVGILVVGLLLAGTGVAFLVSGQRSAATAAQELAHQVRELGGTPVVSAPAPIAGPAGQKGDTGKQGPGPTQQQIDDAVFGYFAVHPPGATPAMVAVQVAAYLTAHPPRPGPPPTAAQISTAASDYIGAHAADFQGQPGQNGANGSNGTDGQPGQNATDDQVAAAVAAYCDSHGQCQGQQGTQGDQGAQGVSITDLQFERDTDGTCMAVVTLHDPATNTDTTVSHTAGDAACPITAPTNLNILGGH